MTIRRAFAAFLALFIIGLGIFFAVRAWAAAPAGPAIAYCPGPDQYGYTCEGADGYAYIDATEDTFLYEDDGTLTVDLPFPFTYYGTEYAEVTISSNGNLQFGGANEAYQGTCLDDPETDAMGELLAVYWDDLNLISFGFVETAVVGEEPNRVFVVEWDDVPRFADANDRVTFEVQLFEGSHDIVYLYQFTNTQGGTNGAEAVVGLRSAQQGVSLAFSCYQPVIASNTGLLFPHPEDPYIGDGPANVAPPAADLLAEDGSNLKGKWASFAADYAANPTAALAELQQAGLNSSPQRQLAWQYADVTGDGNPELILLTQAQPRHAHLNELRLFTISDEQSLTLLVTQPLTVRQTPDLAQPTLDEAVDKSGDGVADVVLRGADGTPYIFSWSDEGLTRMR